MSNTKQKTPGHQARAKASETFRGAAPSHPIRDFIVEFFGILLPGFAFTTGLLLTLVFPICALVISQKSAAVLTTTSTGTEVWQVPEAFQIALLMAAAALSYVWGHVFYRQDLKLPDTISYWSQPEPTRKVDPVGYCDGDAAEAQSKELPLKRWHDHVWESVHVSTLCRKINDEEIARYPHLVDFPYCDLKKWFSAQGMSGLAQFVTWSGSWNNRTRHLDLMKIALEFTFPEQSSRLARNEAHVRLVCSIWYACCHLIYLAVIGILVAVVTNRWADPYSVPYPAALLVPVLSLIVLIWIKRSIEQSLHLMRIREIVFVFAHFRCATDMAPKIMRVFAAGLLEMEGGDGRLVGQGTPKPTTVDGSSGLRRVVDRPSRAEAQHHRDRREGYIPQLALEHGGR